jgi:hypothetical protein
LGGQLEVTGGQLQEMEAALLQQGNHWSHAGSPDLLAGPACWRTAPWEWPPGLGIRPSSRALQTKRKFSHRLLPR